MLNANVQWDDIWRWGLGELLGYEGGALMNGINAFIERPQRASLPLLAYEKTARKQVGCLWTRKWALTRLKLSGLRLPKLWTMRNKLLSFTNHSVNTFYFVLLCCQPKQTHISCFGNKVWFPDLVPGRMDECGCHSKREYS